MNKNLIYCVLGFDRRYIEMAKLLIDSLYRHSGCFDMLIVCPEDYIQGVMRAIDFKSAVYFLEHAISDISDAIEGRFQIYRFDKIASYDKVMYIDLDMLAINDFSDIFEYDLGGKGVNRGRGR